MNSSKKISLFVPTLSGGGAERVMVSLANGFADRGFTVDLVLVKAEGPYLPLISDKVTIVDLNCSRTLASLPGLIHYLKTAKPHAILSTLDHANIVAIIAHILTRTAQKIVVRVANTLSLSTSYSKDIRVHLTAFLFKYFCTWADQIIAVSQGVAEDLIITHNLSRSKIKTIYNPAITPELLHKANQTLSHPWLLPKEPPVIISVGRLTVQKDFPMLIQAFAQVRKKQPARLLILGEGEERTMLESLVKSLGLEQQVSLPGFVDNPFAYMKQAAVFVLSSCFEGMPNALLQAMACGTPVVSTDCPSGPREILEGGKWGKLVPVGNIEAMAEAIFDSLKGNTQCPPVSLLESRFGLDNIIDQYLSVLF